MSPQVSQNNYEEQEFKEKIITELVKLKRECRGNNTTPKTMEIWVILDDAQKKVEELKL